MAPLFCRLTTVKPFKPFFSIHRLLMTQTHDPKPDIPTSTHYDELINAAGRDGDFSRVGHLLNKRFRDGCFNTNNTFKFISTDVSLLDDLLRTLSRLDNRFPRKSAFDSLVARLCKLRRTDDALRVVDAMLRGGYGANAATFYPVLNSLTRRKELEEAWRVMDLMREQGVSPDVTAFNYILTAYCFVGDLESAAGVLARMGDEGMVADTRTYDALVLGTCRAGKIEAALVLLRRMVDEGVPASYSTHAHIIGGLLRSGYCEQAVKFVLSYGGRDKNLDSENFGILATRLIDLKKFVEAKLVLEEMRSRGISMGSKLKDFYEFKLGN